MKYGRLKEMEEYIRKNKSVSNNELLEHFNISIQTLRRDLKTFEDQGAITKVYGGVVYNDESQKNAVSPIAERAMIASREKDYIGRLAADLVEDGDVIFIDSGTTAYRMIQYMNDRKNVTVISHCLDVMNALLVEFRKHLDDFLFRQIDARKMSHASAIVFMFDGGGDFEHARPGVCRRAACAARHRNKVRLEIGQLIERVVDYINRHVFARRKHFKRKMRTH